MALRLAFTIALFVLASPGIAQDRVQVVTTTTDLRSLTEAVGGDRVAAVSLVPPNMDAEDYQPKPQDMLRLKQARLLVRVGLDSICGSIVCWYRLVDRRSAAAARLTSMLRLRLLCWSFAG